jgi:preprotein translocase subunit YajC
LTTWNALALMAPQEGGGAGLTVFAIQMGAIIAIFYFLLIRPQRQAQKRHQQMLSELRKGDEVMTEGGIIGEIVHVKDDRLTLRSGETRVIVHRGKIARLIPSSGETAER